MTTVNITTNKNTVTIDEDNSSVITVATQGPQAPNQVNIDNAVRVLPEPDSPTIEIVLPLGIDIFKFLIPNSPLPLAGKLRAKFIICSIFLLHSIMSINKYLSWIKGISYAFTDKN